MLIRFSFLGEFGVPGGKGERNTYSLTNTFLLMSTILLNLTSPTEFQLGDYCEPLRNFDWNTIVGLAYNFRE